jgi:hypothetical protein
MPVFCRLDDSLKATMLLMVIVVMLYSSSSTVSCHSITGSKRWALPCRRQRAGRDRPTASRVRAGCPNAAGATQPISVHQFAHGRRIDEPPRPVCTKQTAIKKLTRKDYLVSGEDFPTCS